jgi:DNA-binding FadR family transcriptional regulator
MAERSLSHCLGEGSKARNLLPRDLVQQAAEHETIVTAILNGNRQQARQATRKVLTDFWKLWRTLTR